MSQFLLHLGPQMLLTMVLLGVLMLRARINARASLLMKVRPEKLWSLINPYDGKVDNWSKARVVYTLVDPAQEIYRIDYTTMLENGETRPFQAMFKVAERVAERKLTLTRAGLEGKTERNELLQISYRLEPKTDGTRLKTCYLWGSRALIAQPLARADIWSGAFRLKSLAETGIPNEWPFFWISAAVALFTGLASIAAFSFIINVAFAVTLVLVLFVHEFGHLLAFRLIGQPWGRIVFLPFLGAVAVPRLPYESQGQSVFAALMGPGFSLGLALMCLAAVGLQWPNAMVYAAVGTVTAGLNLFNMLPAEPLDGGIALRSVMTRVAGRFAGFGLMSVGLLIAVIGLLLQESLLVIFGAIAMIANFRRRRIDAGLQPLTSREVAYSAFGYSMIAVAHGYLLIYFLGQISQFRG